MENRSCVWILISWSSQVYPKIWKLSYLSIVGRARELSNQPVSFWAREKGSWEFNLGLWLFTKHRVDLKCTASYYFFLVISQIRYGNLALVVLNLSISDHLQIGMLYWPETCLLLDLSLQGDFQLKQQQTDAKSFPSSVERSVPEDSCSEQLSTHTAILGESD